MRAANFRKALPVALAAMIATAAICPTATRAHDDDEYSDYPDDDYGYSDDRDRDDWSGGGWVTYGDDYRSARIPYYASLDGYGAWRYVPSFDTYLWFPWVGPEWRPYYYGHWVRTSFGMTWVSHEAWGDIPFHYGNWVHLEPYGWAWLPGWEYSPAWVTWAVSDGYVGWAPCAPRGWHYPHHHRYTSGLRVSFYGYPAVYDYDDGLDFSFWIFVGDRDFCGRPVYRHALHRGPSLSLFKTKRVLPIGPRLDVSYVQKVSPGKIRTVHLDRVKKDVGGRTLEVYEPRGQKEQIRSGVDVAKRSYVKPVRPEGVSRSERGEKSRMQVRTAPRTETKRVEKAQVEDRRRPEEARHPEKVKQAESRDGGRPKAAEKPAETPKSKNKSGSERAGERSGAGKKPGR